jgi:hypothetical protein
VHQITGWRRFSDRSGNYIPFAQNANRVDCPSSDRRSARGLPKHWELNLKSTGPNSFLYQEKRRRANIIGSVNPCRCRLRLTRLCDRTECVSERLPSRLRRAVFATSCSEKRWRRIPAALSVATEGQELRPIAALLRREQARIHIHRDFSLQHILPLPTSAPSPAWPAPEPRLT